MATSSSPGGRTARGRSLSVWAGPYFSIAISCACMSSSPTVRKVSNNQDKKKLRLRRQGAAQRAQGRRVDGADELLAVALRVDEAGVGQLLHVVRHRRGAHVDVEPLEQLDQEAVVHPALGQVELALVHEAQEELQSVLVAQRPEHPGQLLGLLVP